MTILESVSHRNESESDNDNDIYANLRRHLAAIDEALDAIAYVSAYLETLAEAGIPVEPEAAGIIARELNRIHALEFARKYNQLFDEGVE